MAGSGHQGTRKGSMFSVPVAESEVLVKFPHSSEFLPSNLSSWVLLFPKFFSSVVTHIKY